ncbi:MAG: hypothetical protein ACXADO_04740 [Candidatus Thorarchaeota archaeon]
MSSELSEDLDRAKEVLKDLIQRVSGLRVALEPFERELRAKGFEDSEVYVRGTTNGFICLPTALTPGDLMSSTMQELSAAATMTPSLIKAADPEESMEMTDRTIRMLEWEMGNRRDTTENPRFIIVLRWASMFGPLEQSRTGVIGKRYLAGSAEQLEALIKLLKKTGIAVMFDDGEYGGGLLTYELSRVFGLSRDILIAQLTLSRRVATDRAVMSRLLEKLSSF